LSANLHQSIKVWGFIPKFSAYEETKGTYLEAVEEFWLDQRLKLTMPNKSSHRHRLAVDLKPKISGRRRIFFHPHDRIPSDLSHYTEGEAPWGQAPPVNKVLKEDHS
jgi:hypothetical protein